MFAYVSFEVTSDHKYQIMSSGRLRVLMSWLLAVRYVCDLSDVVCVVAAVSVFLMRIENQLRACAYMCHFSFLILSLIPSSMPPLNSCVVSQRLVKQWKDKL